MTLWVPYLTPMQLVMLLLLIMRGSKEAEVYSDFFTNLAVAWFSAGVIAPVFTSSMGLTGFVGSFVSLVACLFSLKFAVSFRKGEK